MMRASFTSRAAAAIVPTTCRRVRPQRAVIAYSTPSSSISRWSSRWSSLRRGRVLRSRALASDGRSQVDFSNFGGWVDVYAPGERLINAFPEGTFTYQEPPRAGTTATFSTMASWSGTSFSTPMVAGLIAARMSRTGENGRDAAAALVAKAQAAAVPGIGAVLLPDGPCAPHPHPRHCCPDHAASPC
jgi:subtilisin family serine protease